MAKVVALIAFAVLALVSTGCKELECGPGTIERDGLCAPPTSTPDPASCGAGTELDGGKCVPVYDPTICDPATTFPFPDPAGTGITICVGTGAGGCDAPLAGCDMASAGTMTVCGKIYDIQDDVAVGATATDTSECPPGGEATGPCALEILPYDALAFAGNPTGAVPLSTAESYLDHCGRYKLRDIAPSGAPFIGLGVDDHSMQPDNHKLTGVAFPTAANTAESVAAYATRNATDALWTTGTGEGTSLAAQGVYVNIYRDHGTAADPFVGNPAAGVQILRGGVAIANDDYYFADVDPATRAMVAPTSQTVTGANGTGLVLRQPSLAPYSGTMGPLPGGCTWYTSTGAAIAGVVFAQIHEPATAGCMF